MNEEKFEGKGKFESKKLIMQSFEAEYLSVFKNCRSLVYKLLLKF